MKCPTSSLEIVYVPLNWGSPTRYFTWSSSFFGADSFSAGGDEEVEAAGVAGGGTDFCFDSTKTGGLMTSTSRDPDAGKLSRSCHLTSSTVVISSRGSLSSHFLPLT